MITKMSKKNNGASAKRSDLLLFFLTESILYFSLLSGLLSLAGKDSYIILTLAGIFLFAVENVFLLSKKRRTIFHGCVAVAGVILLLVRQNTLYNGGKIFINALFLKSEEMGAYEYDYFSISTTPNEQEMALLWFLVLAAVILAVIVSELLWLRYRLAIGIVVVLFLLTEVYFGVFAKPVCHLLLLAGIVIRMCMCYTEAMVQADSMRWYAIMTGMTLLVICGVVIFFTANEKNEWLSQRTEQWRDDWEPKVVQNRSNPIPQGEKAGQQVFDDDKGSTGKNNSQGDGHGTGMGRGEWQQALSKRIAGIVSDPVPWGRILGLFLFAAVLFYFLYKIGRRSCAVRKRQKLFSGEINQEICCHMFRFLMSCMFCCGLPKENRTYSACKDKIRERWEDGCADYQKALELWHRSAYRNQPIPDAEVLWLRDYVFKMRKKIISELNIKQKWDLYMKYYL